MHVLQKSSTPTTSRRFALLVAFLIISLPLCLRRYRWRVRHLWQLWVSALAVRMSRRLRGTPQCLLCGEDTGGVEKAVFRVPGRRQGCHVCCAVKVVQQIKSTDGDLNYFAPSKAAQAEAGRNARSCVLPQGVLEEFRRLFDKSPCVNKSKAASIRLCHEDLRLDDNLAVCSPTPAPPSICFAMENLYEVRITSCQLRSVPAEAGRLRGLRSLVLMSMELVELPPELGLLRDLEIVYLNSNLLRSVPAELCALPIIKDFCVDANQLKSLPPFTSTKMKMLTAPGNLLCEPLRMNDVPERIDVNGNAFSSLAIGGSAQSWSLVQSIKAQGNRLIELPRHMTANLQRIDSLNVSDNLLTHIPEEIASLRNLRSFHAYRNRLKALPCGLLLGSKRLQQSLLEGNPLDALTMADLVNDADDSYLKCLGIDEEQALTWWSSQVGQPPPLPPCVSVGALIQVGGSHANGMYMKLARASHLRRAEGVGWAGCPGGIASPSVAPASTLIVAFAASQGEPEWLGVLKTVSGHGNADKARAGFPAPVGPLAEFLGDVKTGDARFAPLWRRCEDDEVAARAQELGGLEPDIPDFDVLAVCDGRMRWYIEDASEVQTALRSVCARYERVMFLGASMGGYGAMLHGAELADIVLAFGPQSALGQSILRPPAQDMPTLLEQSQRVRDAVRRARARGAVVEVHCCADTHLEHGLALPLDDLALTVHPLCPRAPMARLMERANVLWPIVAGTLVRLQPTPKGDVASLGKPPGSVDKDLLRLSASERICVARWSPGLLLRYWTTREQLLPFFFGKAVAMLPRPRDWYCATCGARNNWSFFCPSCKQRDFARSWSWSQVPSVADHGVGFVACERPFEGDWGCGKCGTLNNRRDSCCSGCRAYVNDSRCDHVILR